MERFKLVNNVGVEYDVMPTGHSVANFGYANGGNYYRLGNRYLNTLEYLSQNNPQFSIFFPSAKAEYDYLNFVKFLQDAPLKLVIQHSGMTFYQQVRVQGVSKEWFTADVVNATVTLITLTPPYEVLSKFVDTSQIGADGKIYDYKYNYTYYEGLPMNVSLDCEVYTDSPAKLTIFGQCVNPEWNHYVNGNLISRGKLNTTIPLNRKVVIDATTLPYSIKMLDVANNVVQDLYPYSDFTTDRFIYLKNGRNRVVVSQAEAEDVNIMLEAHIYYASI